MSEQIKNFAKECEAIQSKCACNAWDATECYEERYPRDEDDWSPRQHCVCICHQEIAEEEASQEWPNDF